MPKYSHREDILTAGLQVMFKSGYHGTGIRDIVAAANAPQGSFTNHFRSKEAFVSEVLDRYFAYVKGLMHEALEDHSLTPCKRLQRYLEIITSKLEQDNWSRGCLIGDLSLEVSSSSEPLRIHLQSIFQEWKAHFASCIAQAQSLGEISDEFSSDELADFLLAGWQGSILRMKVEQNSAPLERFKKIVFTTIFTRSTPS